MAGMWHVAVRSRLFFHHVAGSPGSNSVALFGLKLCHPGRHLGGGAWSGCGRRSQDKPRPTGGAATSSTCSQGAHPRRRARSASHRACAECGRPLAFPRAGWPRRPGENCVTRRARSSGHLRTPGTPAERARGARERRAGAPATAAGNSPLTGEASPTPTPEVWCLCRGAATAAAEAAERPRVPGCEEATRALQPDPAAQQEGAV